MSDETVLEELEGQCVNCTTHQSLRTPEYCIKCGAPLALGATGSAAAPTAALPGVWKYAARLPLTTETSWLSLGEGNTPLLLAARAASWCRLKRLYLKLDHLNPSGSFKDRATAIGIAHAYQTRTSTVMCASSGNAAVSTSAYAARAGLRAVLVVPESTPAGKLSLAGAHGAVVLRACGDYSNAFSLGRELASLGEWINLTTTYVNPVAISGLKTAGYEIAEQLSAAPDWILVPVGAGPLVSGILTAYRELVHAGSADRLPRLAAVQADGCAPIANAFARGLAEVTPWPKVTTSVSGIADPLRGYPADGTYTLRLVRESGGCAVALSDQEINTATHLLANQEGLLVEPAAASSVAAARKLRREGLIREGDLVVSMITGSGSKTLQPTAYTRAPLVGNVADALRELHHRGVTVQAGGT